MVVLVVPGLEVRVNDCLDGLLDGWIPWIGLVEFVQIHHPEGFSDDLVLLVLLTGQAIGLLDRPCSNLVVIDRNGAVLAHLPRWLGFKLILRLSQVQLI